MSSKFAYQAAEGDRLKCKLPNPETFCWSLLMISKNVDDVLMTTHHLQHCGHLFIQSLWKHGDIIQLVTSETKIRRHVTYAFSHTSWLLTT